MDEVRLQPEVAMMAGFVSEMSLPGPETVVLNLPLSVQAEEVPEDGVVPLRADPAPESPIG